MFVHIFVPYLFAVCALAAPVDEEQGSLSVIPILSQSEEIDGNGSYKYSYETGNGIKREESAHTKLIPRTRSGGSSSEEGGNGDSEEILVQEGSYSYTAPDGTLVSVRYIADENGFRHIGTHFGSGAAPAPIPLQRSASITPRKSGRVLDVANAESASQVQLIKPSEENTNKTSLESNTSKTENSTTSSSESSTTAQPTEVTTDGSTTKNSAEAATTEQTSNATTTEVTSNASTTTAQTIDSSTTELTTNASTTEADVTSPAVTETSSTSEQTNSSTTAAAEESSSSAPSSA